MTYHHKATFGFRIQLCSDLVDCISWLVRSLSRHCAILDHHFRSIAWRSRLRQCVQKWKDQGRRLSAFVWTAAWLCARTTSWEVEVVLTPWKPTKIVLIFYLDKETSTEGVTVTGEASHFIRIFHRKNYPRNLQLQQLNSNDPLSPNFVRSFFLEQEK